MTEIQPKLRVLGWQVLVVKVKARNRKSNLGDLGTNNKWLCTRKPNWGANSEKLSSFDVRKRERWLPSEVDKWEERG